MIAGAPPHTVWASSHASQEADPDGFEDGDGWMVFHNCDVHVEEHKGQVRTMPCDDLDSCKQMCVARGYGGFVRKDGAAVMYTRSRRQLFNARRCTESSVGGTLFVAPAGTEWVEAHGIHRQWVDALEVNLKSIQSLAEERRQACLAAEANGDAVGAETANLELLHLKDQQSRRASALWHATGGLAGDARGPQSGLHTSSRPQATVVEFLDKHCRESDTDLPQTSRVAPEEGVSQRSERTLSRQEVIEMADGVGTPSALCDNGGIDEADIVNTAANTQRLDFQSNKAPVLCGSSSLSAITSIPDLITKEGLMCDDVSQEKLAETGAGYMAISSGAAIETQSIVSLSGDNNGGQSGSRIQDPTYKRALGRGKGGHRRQTPLGRRFHWRGLSAERARGTVFDLSSFGDNAVAEPAEPPLDFEMLKSLFRADSEEEQDDQHADPTQQNVTLAHVETKVRVFSVFSNARAQHVAIVMRRVLGPNPKQKDVEGLAAGLEAIELPPDLAASLLDRDAELLELLASALPTAEEAVALEAAPATSLRQVEQLVVPLAKVPQRAARLRALRLGAQAAGLQGALLARVGVVATASRALRSSGTLRQVLCTVAQLGSWINAADPVVERGFALSSGLGKLRQFRALRGDRELSLLHAVALSAAGGNPADAEMLGRRLGKELDGVAEASRVDLKNLGQAVAGFQTEVDWLAAEAGNGHYTTEVQERLCAIHHRELVWRSEALQEAWGTLHAEWEETLYFFAEPWDNKDGLEEAVGRLLHTVEEFRADLQGAARQVAAQPARFARSLSAGASSGRRVPRHRA